MAASGLDARATAQPNARAAELSPSVSLVARSSAPYLSPRRKPQGTAMTIEAQTPSAPPSNQLGGATSPYLLQHAGNPVHWREWGEAALAEARATGKPILLSVGYATCHWCHVMAHESFEDEQTAALMNRLFVSIKVDREERPDIDHLYMSALHLLGEQGGWPLTMFLTSEGDPFWGGTYFHPNRVGGGHHSVRCCRLWRMRTNAATRWSAATPRRCGRRSCACPPPDRARESARRSSMPRRPRSCDRPIRNTAACAVPRSFPTRRSSGSCCRTTSAPAARTDARRCICCSSICRRVASTIISAAATPATRRTRSGSYRISRRCCTTTHNCSNCSPSPTPTVPRRSMPSAPRRPLAGCCATCARRRVRKPPLLRPKTPIARARKAASTSGPRTRSMPH